jgi:flavin-dependent dehydrogenase
MEKIYDAVVVGAGPAGLMVAGQLGGRGASVLLVDMKKDIPRVFRSCCANLIIEADTHKETVSYAGGAFRFEQNSFSVPYAGAVIPLQQSVKVSAGGSTLLIKGKSPEGSVAVSFEKEALLQGLFSRVQACGTVDIMAETQALGAENTAAGARVKLRTRGGPEFSAQGRVVVAADGVNSPIVESLGLNAKRRKFFARFRVASYHMEGVECPYPDAWVTFIGKGHTLGGRGQLYFCPKPHAGRTSPPVYELTAGVPIAEGAGGVTPVDELEYFTTKSRFAPWFRHAEIVSRRAATLNFYTPLTDPVEGNVVVVGDAAAFIETYVQGALQYGYLAAEAIAGHLATGSGFGPYAAAWADSFEYNDPAHIKNATQGFGLHVLKDEDLDYLFSLTRGDDIRGFVNEFSDPDTVRNALLRHIERIRSERPELAATFEKFGQVSVHDALQVTG